MSGHYLYVDEKEISHAVDKVVVRFIEDMQILELHQTTNTIHTIFLPKTKQWRTSAKVTFG